MNNNVEDLQGEEWRDVVGYEGLYKVSNMGRIKSLPRIVNRVGGFLRINERVLKLSDRGKGYLSISLYRDGCARSVEVHKIVAAAFLSHIQNGNTLVVDHINGIKTHNSPENLRIVTCRFNLSIGARKDRDRKPSRFMGVYWKKEANKWVSSIFIYGKLKHLGYFASEIEASDVYQNELSKYLLLNN